MVVCLSCGTASPDGFRFCGACAAPLGLPGAGTKPAREERRTVSVLFADLAGFTSRAETLDPEDVRAFLVPYYDALTTEITGHGGRVDRFLGDGIMALFGAPVAHEDDPERAVRAALRIVERVPALGLDLHVRVGINTGPVLFVAADGDRDDAVTGDAVNTAARLQAAAPTDGVVVGEATYRATSHLFRYDALDPIRAKGKAEPVPLWRALEPIAHRAGELMAEATPFVGRAFELETLVRLFERARTTPSLEVVTVVADPGIGKSRLVRELARYVDALPDLVTWRVGRCLPYGDGISFWALGEIIKAHAGILDTDDQVTLSAKLDTVLTEPDPQLRAWIKDRLAPLVGLETSTAPPGQEEVFTAWRRFLESIAQAGPTVLIVEDLHWADAALVAFLGHLAANTAGLPILLVATTRPEVEERHPSWLGRARRSTVLSLAALADRDMAALVEATLPGASRELVATVLDRAAGSPLYAEQLAAMFRDRLLSVTGGPLDEDAVPPTIAALLASRIDALRPDAKAILLDASVIGKTFWSGAVAALAKRDRGEVGPLLAELAKRELVRPAFPSTMAGEAEYTFVHALVRDVAYGELPRAARLARHKATAAWITDRAGHALGEDAEIVVAHLERARELATATGAASETLDLTRSLVEALLAAADGAMRTDVPRAADHLRGVLRFLDAGDQLRPETLARLGSALIVLDEVEDGADAIEEARRLYQAGDREVEAALLTIPLYRVLVSRGQTEIADHIFTGAEEVLRRRGGQDLAVYLASAAQVAWARSRNDDALRLAEEALTIANGLGMSPPYRALTARGGVRMDHGDRRNGEADLRESIRLATAAGDTWATLAAIGTLGSMLAIYSMSDALAVIEEERAFERSRGLPPTSSDISRLQAFVALGRWDEAIDGVGPIADQAGARGGDAFIHGFATALRASIEVERGLYGGDPATLADEARRFGRPFALMALFPVAARLANAQGRRDYAAGLLEELAESLTADQLFEMDAVRAAAEIGRPDLARRLRGLAVESVRSTGVLDGLVAEASGDHVEARGAYRTAIAWARTVGVVPEEAYTLAGLGRCLLALGDTEEGVVRLRESRAIWERLRATPRIAEIDALLATVGASPDPA